MKKLLSVLLSFALVFSFAAVAVFADEPTETKGTIYINNIGAETEYSIYKLLDLAGFDANAQAYRYTVAEKWTAFFATADAQRYVTIDSKGTVTATTEFTEDTAADFAKIALAYAKANDIAFEANNNSDNYDSTDTAAKFTDLELGYYLVDSSMGALCGLTTTKPEASITVKNSVPTVDKNVQEDSIASSDSNSWGKTNSADIGQEIKFDVTIFAQAGAENYVYHDEMENMVLLMPETEGEVTKYPFTVYHHKTAEDEEEILEAGTDYTLVTDPTDGCSFEVVFEQSRCDQIKANDKLYIKYSGKLTNTANIGRTEGNVNKGWVTFGDINHENKNHKTNIAQTTTYTYGVDVVKTDSNYNMLEGAEFKLYTTATGGTPIPLAYNPNTNTYRIYQELLKDSEGTAIEQKPETIVVTADEERNNATIARIIGLDNGVYYLEEVVTPEGYNPLTSRKAFTISNENIDASFTGERYDNGSGVHVENKTGTTMPETGGMGTTMFILIGTITVLGAGVLLVTKKRMSMIED